MTDPNVPAGTRLRAAEVVLGQATKAIEVEAIDASVAELERAAASANRSRKRSAILTCADYRGFTRPGYKAVADIHRAPSRDSK